VNLLFIVDSFVSKSVPHYCISSYPLMSTVLEL
jgi:hypothetical protein